MTHDPADNAAAPSAPAWPTLPQPGAAAIPAHDPLDVPERRTLAPEGMPTRPDAVTERPASPQSDALPPDQGERVSCPRCGQPVPTYASFCEDCGAPLTPTTARPDVPAPGRETPLATGTAGPVAAPAEATVTRPDSPAAEPDLSQPASRTCPQCGGVIGPDGYCTGCGARAVPQRDHYGEQPAPWLAGLSDRGVRHSRNEDALALATLPDVPSGAVIVICDGVSTSEDSDVASLAAARASRAALLDSLASVDAAEDRSDDLAAALTDAARRANQAVIDTTAAGSENAASCTWVAAVTERGRVTVANVGDSRAYWLPDTGDATILTVDDSVAQARIQMGVSREEAEHGFQAHAITKWLGRDSDDVVPRVRTLAPASSGWLLVCSDGLWNYCTEPDALRELVARQGSTQPAPVADGLVRWACEQGGRDNITVALARVDPAEDGAETPLDTDSPTVASTRRKDA